ncbi:hypothetical protein NliqN6_1256 [Naganishia liquefaciens]|uniref:Uncharacterized protein n=1 Tax=Naganishia liquefaciens TaxID=104408 RepID=A0A8H3TPZ8_9TREE|nr:hypothetical protein NliqN6_1256 [Naganishia liquefaciens]
MVFVFNPPQVPPQRFPPFRPRYPPQDSRPPRAWNPGFSSQQAWMIHGSGGVPGVSTRFCNGQTVRRADDEWGNAASGGTSRAIAPPRPIPLLVVRFVAKHLASSHAFATLAKLNVTCRAIHETTLHDLYKTVYLNWATVSSPRQHKQAGWNKDRLAVEKWRKMRWDDRLQSSKGAPHIDFLFGPPMHRHFYIAWENRKHWIPKGLVGTLKAAATFPIDASAVSSEIVNELEVFLCGNYRFGTDDAIKLLDAIEPPLQDRVDPASESLTFHTRLVFFVDSMHVHELRWPGLQKNTVARRHLELRTYPWLRCIDLVLCTLDALDAAHVQVVVTELLTMLLPAVRAWCAGDKEARPELVVKGLNVEAARTCTEVLAGFISEDESYSCIDLKLLGTHLARDLNLTAALYLLQPVQSMYVSLCACDRQSTREDGSTSIGDLDAADRLPDRSDATIERDVSASACVVGAGEEVHFVYTEEGKMYKEVARRAVASREAHVG